MDERTRVEACDAPIRVLFISHDCHIEHYTEQTEFANWYEGAVAFYGGSRVQVGIAYGQGDEADAMVPSALGAQPSAGITYYPLRADLRYGATGPEWDDARRMLLEVVNRFEPDIVQCFGSEWPHAAIAEDIDAPVVVHMMGFLNIYYPSIDMANGNGSGGGLARTPRWRAAIRRLLSRKRDREARDQLSRNAAFELRVMRANRFFMGRTEWDRNIVRYYSPGSRYFEVPELMRFPFIREAGQWRYHFDGKLRLLTVASADDRKGLDIVLRTAQLLKELVGIDVEWRIAGHEQGFERFERRSGIRREDVGIRLLGMLDVEGIVSELKSADLFVHASIVDNSPRALCEAQMVGCPAISSYVGGVPQLVEHGVTGFLYPYNEPHTLAFLIANLAEQKELLTNVSHAASRTALARHDTEAIIDRTIDVYKEVIAHYEK